jgi:hypothetical protein
MTGAVDLGRFRQRRLKRSPLSPLSKRLAADEVALVWFRRQPHYGQEIRRHHPDFPRPGPDGLYLASEVETWFDRWHGRRPQGAQHDRDAEEQALRAALGGQDQTRPQKAPR